MPRDKGGTEAQGLRLRAQRKAVGLCGCQSQHWGPPPSSFPAPEFRPCSIEGRKGGAARCGLMGGLSHGSFRWHRPCSHPTGAEWTTRWQREGCRPQGGPRPGGLRVREMGRCRGRSGVLCTLPEPGRGAYPQWDVSQGELGEHWESRLELHSPRLPSGGLTRGTHMCFMHPEHRACLCWAPPQCPLLTPTGICF